jgi:hypothetical protein
MKFIFGMLTGILLSTMFFIWYAKKNLVPDNNTSTEQVVATTATDENGFEAFYERFHSDSLFQIASGATLKAFVGSRRIGYYTDLSTSGIPALCKISFH